MARALRETALSEGAKRPSRRARARLLPENRSGNFNGFLTVDDAIVVAMRYVYILRCQDNSLYIGETDELTPRIERHNEGRGCVYTACRLPVSLVYAEQFATRIEAVKRERQLKGWTREKKEALIAGDLSNLRRLARSRQLSRSNSG